VRIEAGACAGSGICRLARTFIASPCTESGMGPHCVFEMRSPIFSPYWRRTGPDPARDLDRAGYGLVKVLPESPGETSLRWEPKEAFFTVAENFAQP
jgi:hypothetical protein